MEKRIYKKSMSNQPPENLEARLAALSDQVLALQGLIAQVLDQLDDPERMAIADPRTIMALAMAARLTDLSPSVQKVIATTILTFSPDRQFA